MSTARDGKAEEMRAWLLWTGCPGPGWVVSKQRAEPEAPQQAALPFSPIPGSRGPEGGVPAAPLTLDPAYSAQWKDAFARHAGTD